MSPIAVIAKPITPTVSTVEVTEDPYHRKGGCTIM